MSGTANEERAIREVLRGRGNVAMQPSDGFRVNGSNAAVHAGVREADTPEVAAARYLPTKIRQRATVPTASPMPPLPLGPSAG
jgi:hypothetical protein